ncbi:MAG: hypothetical protein KKA73_07095 [Chloroflexi bacterium]|nr:hypothetical protein [Chloroflexota bacterium]MBU1747436.1 hypothetical protein [Chloroflexota bacterium]
MTEHVHIAYRLTFTSAFHFGTGLREGLIHRPVARDADGFLYVPGSTLKGALRDRCEQVARLFDLQVTGPHTEDSDLGEANPNVSIIVRIFGSRFWPGQLYFDDAYLIEPDRAGFEPPGAKRGQKLDFRAWQTEKRTQVGLSRLTRTAQRGLLYHSEYGIQGLHFAGQITGLLSGFAADEGQPVTYSLLLLLAGLKSLDRIGGNKSAGAGQITCEIAELLVNEQPLEPDNLLNQLEEIEYYQLMREEVAT